MPDALTKLREVLGTLDLDAKTHQAVFAAVEELRLHQVNLEHEVADQYIFWTNLTHELRTNLSGVIGFSELLNSQIHGELNDEQLKRLDKVLIHARQLLHLANDIIDLSKIKTNTLQLNPQKIDIQTFLRKFSEQLSLRGHLKNPMR